MTLKEGESAPPALWMPGLILALWPLGLGFTQQVKNNLHVTTKDIPHSKVGQHVCPRRSLEGVVNVKTREL